MMRLTFCTLLCLAACGGHKSHPVDGPNMHPDNPGMHAATGDQSCPLEVPGTSVTVEDTTSGAALVFVTTGDTAAVRARATALAAMHTKHDGPQMALGMMFPADWTAAEKDIENGARVEFAAAKPDGAANVQSQLRMHAGHLTSGTCGM